MRVLVVDDNKDAADMLAWALAWDLGCDTKVAYAGDEGVKAAEGFEPHVAILDLNMPRMDGFEAAQALSARRPGMVLIAVTGNPAAAARAHGGEAGFTAELLKPVDLALLVKTIERSLIA